MAALFLILFLIVVGPLAMKYGADSRVDEPGWFGRPRGR
jgi:hypothetical protein